MRHGRSWVGAACAHASGSRHAWTRTARALLRKTLGRASGVPRCEIERRHLGTQCGKNGYGIITRRLSPVTCLLKLIPRAFTFTPSLVPGGACPPGSWIWQLTSYSPSVCSPVVEDVAWTAKSALPPQKSGGSEIRPSGVVTSPQP